MEGLSADDAAAAANERRRVGNIAARYRSKD